MLGAIGAALLLWLAVYIFQSIAKKIGTESKEKITTGCGWVALTLVVVLSVSAYIALSGH